MKKKLLVIMMALVLVLTACQGQNAEQPTGNEGKDNTVETEGKTLKVGVVQLMEHQSLDNTRDGFVDELKKSGLDVDVEINNAQGEITNAKAIVDKYASDGVDLIYAIATPAAEAAMAATTTIPIVFSAVTDPVEAQLVESVEKPGGNITGASDMVDVKNQLALFKEINPDIKTIGIIYSADESNSVQQVESVEKIAPEVGLEVKKVSIHTLSDIPQATESIVGDIDGLYLLSDNKVSSSTTVVTEIMNREKVPVVATVEADVNQGALISIGIDYTDLGSIAGQKALEILKDKKSPSEVPVYVSDKFAKIINVETLNTLGLDINAKVFEGATPIGE